MLIESIPGRPSPRPSSPIPLPLRRRPVAALRMLAILDRAGRPDGDEADLVVAAFLRAFLPRRPGEVVDELLYACHGNFMVLLV